MKMTPGLMTHNSTVRLVRALAVLHEHRHDVFAYAREHNLFDLSTYVKMQWGVTIGRTSLGTWLREQTDFDYAGAVRLKRATNGALGGAKHFGHQGSPDPEPLAELYKPRWPVRSLHEFSAAELARIRHSAASKLKAGRAGVAYHKTYSWQQL